MPLGTDIARWIVTALGAYLALGLPISAAFVTLGVQRADPAARGTGPLFRLLILPGCAALWPLMLARWLSAPRPAAPSHPSKAQVPNKAQDHAP